MVLECSSSVLEETTHRLGSGSLRVRLVRSVVHSYDVNPPPEKKKARCSAPHHRHHDHESSTPTGWVVPPTTATATTSLWETFAAASRCWGCGELPSLNALTCCPPILEEESPEEEEEFNIDDVSSSLRLRLLLLPESTSLREEQEVVLIEPPRTLAPSTHRRRRCQSAEPRLETATFGITTCGSSSIVVPSSRSQPPANNIHDDVKDNAASPSERPDQQQPLTQTKKNKKGHHHHRRLASTPAPATALPAAAAADGGGGTTPLDLMLWTLAARLEELQQQYGSHHPLVAAGYNQLGNVCFRHHQYDLALDAYRRAVLLCRCDNDSNSSNRHHPDNNTLKHLAHAYANMGTVFVSTGQLDRAIAFLEQALHVHEQLLGNHRHHGGDDDDDPQEEEEDRLLARAAVQYQLGRVYTLLQEEGSSRDGDDDRTLKHLQGALATQQRVLGDGGCHPDVVRTIDALGQAHLRRGDYQSALQCHEEALRIRESLYQKQLDGDGDGHDNRSKVAFCESLLHIAAVHRARNDLQAAIFTYRAIVDLQQQELLRQQQPPAQLPSPSSLEAAAASWNTLGELYVESRQNNSAEEAQKAYDEADRLYDAAGTSPVRRPARSRIIRSSSGCPAATEEEQQQQYGDACWAGGGCFDSIGPGVVRLHQKVYCSPFF